MSQTGGSRTLSDLNCSSDDNTNSDSNITQESYTGVEKSGMPVQDPTKDNDVDGTFNQVRQLGAVEGNPDDLCPPSNSRSFTGTARLLSGETVPPPQEPEEIHYTIVIWRNGFTVNDGPLRMLDNPENKSFLETIKRYKRPRELDPRDSKTEVYLEVIKRKINFPEPENYHVAFQGVGRTLAGSSSNTGPPEPIVASAPLNAALSPSMVPIVDETLPYTSIRLRLGDGTHLVGCFNYYHTISDIRSFIDASRPGGARTYQLQTMGFPPKQLTDMTHTIEQAGLANSVIIQKL